MKDPNRRANPQTPWKGRTLKEWYEAYGRLKVREASERAKLASRVADLQKQLGGGEVAVLKSENAQLRHELSGVRAQSPRGAAGTSVGGHPSIADFRLETYDGFRRKSFRLPKVYAEEGAFAASERATYNATFDLDLLGLAPPVTAETVKGRDRTAKMFTNPALTLPLMLDESAGRVAFRALMHSVHLHYFGPAVPHLFRRTSELSKDTWQT